MQTGGTGDYINGVVGVPMVFLGSAGSHRLNPFRSTTCFRLRGSSMAEANHNVEFTLRKCLEADGYGLTPLRLNGETGVDIIASKAGESLHIEVIGFKDSPPARSKDFYEVFFRAISRLKDGATRIVIALPERFSQGLHQRAAVYGSAWQRLGEAFPELEIWLIDLQQKSYRRTTWAEWLVSTQSKEPSNLFSSSSV